MAVQRKVVAEIAAKMLDLRILLVRDGLDPWLPKDTAPTLWRGVPVSTATSRRAGLYVPVPSCLADKRSSFLAAFARQKAATS